LLNFNSTFAADEEEWLDAEEQLNQDPTSNEVQNAINWGWKQLQKRESALATARQALKQERREFEEEKKRWAVIKEEERANIQDMVTQTEQRYAEARAVKEEAEAERREAEEARKAAEDAEKTAAEESAQAQKRADEAENLADDAKSEVIKLLTELEEVLAENGKLAKSSEADRAAIRKIREAVVAFVDAQEKRDKARDELNEAIGDLPDSEDESAPSATPTPNI
jgi:chromosome segregation ATPase